MNVIPNLSALHIAFIREHNRLVAKLAALNTPWKNDDEKLYQTARKIVGAYMQHITYDEYLPHVLNSDLMESYKLKLGTDYKYKPDVNAGIQNVFAAAAFRYGHSQVPNHQGLTDDQGKLIKVQYFFQ